MLSQNFKFLWKFEVLTDALDSFVKFVLQQEDFQLSDVKFNDHNTLDAFGINSNVSYNVDYNIEVIPSLFEDQISTDNF